MISWGELEGFCLNGGYKPGKVEKGFQTEILGIIRGLGYIAFHIPDVGLGNKFLDVFFVDKGGICRFIEFKKIKLDSFNISQFEESQVILLGDLDKRNKDLARVFIYSIKHNRYKVLTFTEIMRNKNEKGGLKLFK